MTWAVGGISSFAGAALAPRINRRLGANRTMVLGLAVFSLFTLCVPLASGATVLSLILLILVQLGDGFYVIYEINLVSTRQEITAERMLGRVSATMQVLVLGAALLGTLAGGLLGEFVGVRATLFLGSGGKMVAALALAWMLFRLPRGVPGSGVSPV
jgi:predicted MFS family arabinose efflux permease